MLIVAGNTFFQDAHCQTNLRTLSDEQLIQVFENEDITTSDYYTANKYPEWTREDMIRILGVIYLDAYNKGEDLGDMRSEVVTIKSPGKTEVNKIRSNSRLSSLKWKNIQFLENYIANTLFFWTNTCFNPEDD